MGIYLSITLSGHKLLSCGQDWTQYKWNGQVQFFLSCLMENRNVYSDFVTRGYLYQKWKEIHLNLLRLMGQQDYQNNFDLEISSGLFQSD